MTSLREVQVLGGGAAALATARALAHHRIGASLMTGPIISDGGPDLLLNQPTIDLLQDLFDCRSALGACGVATRGRLVCWGHRGAEPAVVEEPGIAIASGTLLRILRESLLLRHGKQIVRRVEVHSGGIDADAIWTVDARGRGARGPQMGSIGGRVAICGRARLSGEADDALCVVEAVEQAWLFLLPLGNGRAAVQAVVPARPRDADGAFDAVLRESRLIGRLVAAIEGESRILRCAPGLHERPARPGWIAAGEAALSFDPLCGDGTGQALRCGLLAAAVISAIAHGEPEEACLAHYRNRLARTMRAHLAAIVAFYKSSPCPAVWKGDIEAAEEALDRIGQRDNDATPIQDVRYRLNSFALLRVAG